MPVAMAGPIYGGGSFPRRRILDFLIVQVKKTDVSKKSLFQAI